MAYVCSTVDDLEGKKKVCTHECVALVQYYTNAGPANGWQQGESVLGNQLIKKGTAIATFKNGRYPNGKHGNHAAFFVRQGMNGFYVMDQWKGGNKLHISERFQESRGKSKDGTFAAFLSRDCAGGVGASCAA